MHSLKLGKSLTVDAACEDYMTNAWNSASEERRIQAVNKGTEEQKERKKTLWYELVQAFNKKSVCFLYK